MTAQVLARGERALVVGRDGEAYAPERWPESATFRSGGQANLLVADNRTRQWEEADAAEREIDSWPIGRPFPLAPRMQAITLDVIMAAIFGIEGRPRPGTPEHGLRMATKSMVAASTLPGAKLAELRNLGREEPIGLTKAGLAVLDRPTYAVIAKRRRESGLEERSDVMSLLMRAETEDGETLTDGRRGAAVGCGPSGGASHHAARIS